MDENLKQLILTAKTMRFAQKAYQKYQTQEYLRDAQEKQRIFDELVMKLSQTSLF